MIPSFNESLALLAAVARKKPHAPDCDCRYCAWRRSNDAYHAGIAEREQKRKAMLEARKAKRAAR
jgi:hypothetical protein